MIRKDQRILLVEDNDDDVELARLAFDKSRTVKEMVVVSDGQQALDYLFAEGTALPQLVLLDLNLPKIGGLEVLQRMRADARTKLVPVVIMTTSDEEQDVMSSYRLGANSYVRKPVDFTQFVETARQLGSYWLAVNEPPPL